MEDFNIRKSNSGDIESIERLYPDAFPSEELRPLVLALLRDTPQVLSLVARAGPDLVGHVVMTPCRVSGLDVTVALLGPLAVATAWQRRGIGSRLIRAGFDELQTAGYSHVFVLGDPAYYRRFGFQPERTVAPPYPIPDEWRDAWQSRAISGVEFSKSGSLIVPPAWNERAYWAG
ncbi:MAG: N-acetyltransferase [Rhodobacteraceae bacterium]|nr:N-acetyltransferase [Paracoccaceae bacterium]